ncbi:FUSC family protein [Rhizobium grahamii]|uniref:FUSC family protein n=1 Tax=Rhizobium grahamii TaxID=1120045 RepID=UPI001678D6A3|nr:FUSC family protein [Rhizobium grahamii]
MVARVTYISLGIIVEACFAAVLAPGTPSAALRARFLGFARSVANYTSSALRGKGDSATLQGLIAATVELDAVVEFASASSPDVGRRLGQLRAAIAAATTQLIFAGAFERHPQSPVSSDVADAFASLAADPSAEAPSLRAARELASISASAPESLSSLRLRRLVDAAESSLQLASSRKIALSPRSMRRFRIERAAAVNAARAFLAVIAASVFWIESAWSSGGSVVVIVAIVVSLFASRPDGVSAGIGFVQGAVAAIVVAGLCSFVLLPAVSGFPALASIVAPFLIAGGIAMRFPKTVAAASSFTLFVWDLIAPDKTLYVDFSEFANGALALLLGIACGTLMFAIIFPYRPVRLRKTILGAMRRNVVSLAADPRRSSHQDWLRIGAERVARHAAASRGAPAETRDHEFQTLLAGMTVGIAVLTLSGLSGREPSSARTVAALLHVVSLDRQDRLAAIALRAEHKLLRLGEDARFSPDRQQDFILGPIACADIGRLAGS